MMRLLCLWVWLSVAAFANASSADASLPETSLPKAVERAQSLAGLLQQVKQFQQQESAHEKSRERDFLAQKNKRQAALTTAKAELRRQQKRAEQLKREFDKQELQLSKKEQTLRLRVGNLGEMFGVVRQVASDFDGVLANSLTRVEKPLRQVDLGQLSEAKELPNIQQLQGLWFALQEEMTLNGQISQFDAPVVQLDGREQQQRITRIGVFNALTDQGYVRFDEQTGRLIAMTRQPSEAGLVDDYLNDSGVQRIAIDPTRGALLSLVLSNPDIWARVHQGDLVGYIIIVLAILGLGIAMWRLLSLWQLSQKMNRQLKTLERPTLDNPLGRVLAVAQGLQQRGSIEQETLELKIDEAILKEVPPLEKGQAIIKLFAAIAPLLGLLGTVTGMIATFQAITNFGTGDPKLMAGGISQALITTVLGLVAAIPLLLSHNLVSSQSKRLIQILDEQAAGLIAMVMERRDAQLKNANSDQEN